MKTEIVNKENDNRERARVARQVNKNSLPDFALLRQTRARPFEIRLVLTNIVIARKSSILTQCAIAEYSTIIK